MFRNPFIKNIFGILLIAVFALCNTPVKVLHTLFANHTDYINHHLSDSSTPQLHTAGIDCHCQSNVVVNPYACGGFLFMGENISFFTTANSWSKLTFPFYRNITTGLRGPPTLIA